MGIRKHLIINDMNAGYFSIADIFNFLIFQFKRLDKFAIHILLVKLDWNIHNLSKIAIHMNFFKSWFSCDLKQAPLRDIQALARSLTWLTHFLISTGCRKTANSFTINLSSSTRASWAMWTSCAPKGEEYGLLDGQGCFVNLLILQPVWYCGQLPHPV